MSMQQLSNVQKDLLESEGAGQGNGERQMTYKSGLEDNVRPKTDGVPEAKSTVVPHELLCSSSRAQTRLADVIADQRSTAGNAFAEHSLQMLEMASLTNRGPEGVFDSSRLHWDLLLGRDEAVFPSDYLNFDVHYKL